MNGIKLIEKEEEENVGEEEHTMKKIRTLNTTENR